VEVEDGIHVLRYYEPVHHQLKVGGIAYAANNAVVLRSLGRIDQRIRPDAVINFNHDYAFARRAFSSSAFVTVINDDFEGMARPWIRRATSRRLAETCAKSDTVFAVSEVLVDRVAQWSSRVELLLPWARAYDPPAPGRVRETVLYYGYVNEKVDWELVEALARDGLRLRFTGPVDPGCTSKIKALCRLPNVEITPPVPLDRLDVSDVACSLVPYDTSLPYVQVMTLGNRVLQLLSRGVPIVHARLPRFISCPDTVVRLCDELSEYEDAIAFFGHHFDSVQDDIRDFLRTHSAAERMSQIARAVPALAVPAAEHGGNR